MPSLQQGGTCGHPACKEVRRTVKLHSTRTPSTAPLASNVQGAVVHVYEGGAGHNAQFGAYRAADRFSAPRGEFLLLLPPQPIEHFIASARGQRDGRGLAGTWQVGKIIKGYDMVCFLAEKMAYHVAPGYALLMLFKYCDNLFGFLQPVVWNQPPLVI